jgi:tetratricopeptide (TPR) repeat protein
METLVLEKYILDAEKAFEEKNYMEGMRLLQEALLIEPHYGKAHNHLGWLYLYQINDWEKAEIHLNLALKYASSYSAPYIHMSHILFEKGKFDALNTLLKKAESLGSLQRPFIYNEYGRINEAKGNLRKAVKWYKAAIRNSFNDQDINIYKDNIRRCRDKRWILWF